MDSVIISADIKPSEKITGNIGREISSYCKPIFHMAGASRFSAGICMIEDLCSAWIHSPMADTEFPDSDIVIASPCVTNQSLCG